METVDVCFLLRVTRISLNEKKTKDKNLMFGYKHFQRCENVCVTIVTNARARVCVSMSWCAGWCTEVQQWLPAVTADLHVLIISILEV